MAMQNTNFPPNIISGLLKGAKHIHFIGIGGVSMCELAELTFQKGFSVSGSDRVKGERSEKLESMGIKVFYQHQAENLNGCDAVVYTVAVDPQNAEYKEAVGRGLPLFSRSDYMAWLLSDFENRIGVAGMNGKSTVTAMIAHLMLPEHDPTVLCGAEIVGWGSGFRSGKDEREVIFEACEYMDSFLDFSPTLAIVLNIGLDHVDYFKDLSAVRSSFRKFAEKTIDTGCVLANADDEETVKTFEGFEGKIHWFSIGGNSEFTARNLSQEKGFWSFDFYHHQTLLEHIKLPVPGRFNVENALASCAAAILSGRKPKVIKQQMESFPGLKRRMEYRGELNGAHVYDDYAHHPSAIEATLEMAKQMGYSRIICTYQPHTYSRTAGLFDEFSHAFSDADLVFLAPIYAAREKNESGVSSNQLAKAIGEKAVSSDQFGILCNLLESEVAEGDLLIIMGAGDIEDIFSNLPIYK